MNQINVSRLIHRLEVSILSTYVLFALHCFIHFGRAICWSFKILHSLWNGNSPMSSTAVAIKLISVAQNYFTERTLELLALLMNNCYVLLQARAQGKAVNAIMYIFFQVPCRLSMWFWDCKTPTPPDLPKITISPSYFDKR